MSSHNKQAVLHFNGRTIELPLLAGALGPDVIDVRQLSAQGLLTYDPGFMSTASCSSAITYIDGAQGVLLHRGYPIDELAQRSSFLELSYLLFHGELPTPSQYTTFMSKVQGEMLVHEQLVRFFTGFRRDAHPMAVMCGVIGALSAFYHDMLDFSESRDREEAAVQLLAKMPTLAAMCYKYSIGQPFMYPRYELGYTENFLHMMFATPCAPYTPNPVVVRALDRILMLHADHEQNASTSTVRLAGSTGASPFACVSAGIAALWGSAHGGANEAVLNMLDDIGENSEENIQRYVDRAKDKNDPFRLMGFGHRVYRNVDPRAKVMKESCDEVLDALGMANDPKLQIARRLEEVALQDPYFIERKLYPNVDFYSGLILRAIGIPTNMFTVMFALARTAGWISHWNEMAANPHRIGRPRQLYVGPTERHYPSS